jgi:hypothetical protein
MPDRQRTCFTQIALRLTSIANRFARLAPPRRASIQSRLPPSRHSVALMPKWALNARAKVAADEKP